MKKLYTFKWTDSGRKEEPLQAHTVNQALYILIHRYKSKNSDYDRYIILNAFKDGRLIYALDEPYKHIREPNPPSEAKLEPKNGKDEYKQIDFKGFINNPWPSA